MSGPPRPPARAAKVEATFLSALDRAPEEREAFVAGACAGDDELGAEVKAMLALHGKAGDFMAEPPLTPEIEAEMARCKPEEEGERIGRYKLLQEIGEGGFGTVWMAEQQEPVVRKVALKIIKLGMDTKEVIARFESERQALAMMDHPNIAKVLDAGATQYGRPFFVMELVKGMSITQYCDEAGLGTRERLALFGDVCSAINHAHQKGIIHRDIKPSNVMVTMHGDKAVVKVIDFGIAKATQGKLTDKTLFTRFEQFIGTPVYMSPEQAATSGLDIDTRSDIYALGILLYEMLVGKPPFDAQSLASAGYEEMRRIIREVEPVKPSSRLSTFVGEERTLLAKSHRIEEGKLNKLVEPDLDWIVMKAIDKDRTRRYETANAFAQDIVRFLTDQPVTATPPSAGYQFRKFARRNKTTLRVAAVIAAVLVAATAVSTWQAFRAMEAEKKTAETLKQVAAERDAKDEARKEAEARREEAVRNLAFAKKGNELLGSVFAGLDPRQIAESGRPLQDVLRENLLKAVKELEGSAIGDPLEVAAMQNTLGTSLVGLGDAKLAVELFEKARDTYKARLGPEHHSTLTSMGSLAEGYQLAGQVDKALPLYEEAFKLMKATLGPEHPDTVSIMGNLALAYREAGQRDKALPLFEETLKLNKGRLGPDHPDTLNSMNTLANGYTMASQLDMALPLLEEALKLSKAKHGAEFPTTFVSMNNLAMGYLSAGQSEKALPLLEESLKLMKVKLGPEHPSTLISMANLGEGYLTAGQMEKALPLLEEALKLMKVKLDHEHPRTLAMMNNLATAYVATGQSEKALPLYEETLKLTKAKLGPEHRDTLSCMNNLAMSYANAGKRDKALPLLALYEESLKLMKARLGSDHADTLTSLADLAAGYQLAGQMEKALPLFEETLKLTKAKLGPDHPDTLIGMKNLAEAYLTASQLDKALPLLEETLKITKATLGPEHPGTLIGMSNLGEGYQAAGQLDKALPLFEETLKLMKARLGPEAPRTLISMGNLGEAYRAAGQLDKALPLLEETLKLIKARLGLEHPRTLAVMNSLAMGYATAGQMGKALPLLEETIKLEKAKFGADHPDILKLEKALQAMKSGRLPDSSTRPAAPSPADIKSLEAALDSARKEKGPEHADAIAAMTKLAAAYGADGSGRKAIKLGEEALAIARRALPAGDQRTVEAMKVMVQLYKLVDLNDEAGKLEAEIQAAGR